MHPIPLIERTGAVVRRFVFAVLVACAVASGVLATPSTPTAAGAVGAQTPTGCATAIALANGGFEDPAISGVSIRDQSTVPGWSTTAGDGAIEMWNSNTGTTAGTGAQFVELNANQVSNLFQDLATVPGQLLRWELQHRGRDGVDVMRVALGGPGVPGVQQGPLIADGNTGWGTYSGLYTVPAGQTTTRFSFESISSVGGASYGNFLDSISLGTAACVVVTKSVSNVTRPGDAPVVGDVLQYDMSAANAGGVPAALTVVTDTMPLWATFVAGSLTDENGPVTDGAGDDAGEHVAGTLTWRIGDGADATSGGSIPAGETRRVTFQVTVDAGAFGRTLVNTAEVAFVESLSSTPANSTSNTTSTTVAGTADLAVNQTLDTPLASGAGVQYTITVVNHGPQASAVTHLMSVLPFTGMVSDQADCAVVATDLECDFGPLGVGASRVVVVTGSVPASAAGGGSAQLSSVVDGSPHDPDPLNNVASTVTSIPVAAGITLRMSISNTSATSPGGPAHVGDVLQGRYTVTNTGNVDVTGLSVTDPIFGAVTCAPTSLASGAGRSRAWPRSSTRSPRRTWPRGSLRAPPWPTRIRPVPGHRPSPTPMRIPSPSWHASTRPRCWA